MNLNINVSTVVKAGDEVLVLKRKEDRKYFPGMWTIPGGGMETTDATIESAAEREVKEECGLDVIAILIPYNNIANDILFLTFIADYAGDKSSVVIQETEISDYKWISIGMLNNFEFTPFTKERLRSVLNDS
jgi:8-oxo-dGTP pyrophosphatase MutT (NUDIX family)